MNKTKVKRDEHGLYVRGAGYIWRPDFPLGEEHAFPSETRLQEGESVFFRHWTGSWAKLKGSAKEVWRSHGPYLYPERASEECWRPEPNWRL